MAITADLESMLGKFEEVETNCKKEATGVIEMLGPLQQQLEGQGDTNNPHTPETVDSLQAAINMLTSRIAADITSVKAKLEVEAKHLRMGEEYEPQVQNTLFF